MCYRPRLLIRLLAVSSSTVSGRDQIPPTLESVRAQINARDASIRSLKYRVTIKDQARRGLLRVAAFMSKTEVVEVLTDYSLGHSPNSRAKIDVTATLPEGAPGPKTPGVQRWTHYLSNVASKDARMLEQALQGDALVGVILKQSALIWTTSPDEFLGLAYWSPANILFRDRITAKVQGLDRIDGREVVRLAWEFEPNLNLSIGDHRGECWVAPDLGYALVRSTASSRGGPETPWKETARVDASEFRRVDKVWLPGQAHLTHHVYYDDLALELAKETYATFENWVVNPPLGEQDFVIVFPAGTVARDELRGGITYVKGKGRGSGDSPERRRCPGAR